MTVEGFERADRVSGAGEGTRSASDRQPARGNAGFSSVSAGDSLRRKKFCLTVSPYLQKRYTATIYRIIVDL